MKIISAFAHLLEAPASAHAYQMVERAARICYKSEDKIQEGSAETLIRSLIQRGHESVLEHVSCSALLVCDRGVSHEIVRHRLASYSQESTRYCCYTKDKYGNEITVIAPTALHLSPTSFKCWKQACESAEKAYLQMMADGCTPQQARAVLPNSLKTELVMTTNIREWRHFFRLRCSNTAHPQMQEIACSLFDEMRAKYPVFFEDFA